MADWDDVRRLALALPGVEAEPGATGFDVGGKGFAWMYREKVYPRKARVLNPTVVALRVADEGEKLMLIHAEPEKFFTTPHYHGYPAVLAHLPALTLDELGALLTEAHRCRSQPPPRRRRSAG